MITLAGNFWGLVLGQSVIALPYVVRGVLAGQAHHQAQVEEAAVSLGARPWRALLEVTIPMIRPGLISGAFLAFFASFDDVPVALFMGGGPGSTTFPLQVLASLEFSLKPDIMALSTLIMIGTIVMLVVLDRALGLERLLHGRPAGLIGGKRMMSGLTAMLLRRYFYAAERCACRLRGASRGSQVTLRIASNGGDFAQFEDRYLTARFTS